MVSAPKWWVMLLALFVASTCNAQRAPRRPNVVFFLADDLGWRDLGRFGSSFYETPNIDALTTKGMRFTSAYAACPVCSPTRASILAGKYPARMNTTAWFGDRRVARLIPPEYVHQLPHEEVTLAEALKDAGYRTGFFGKWHLGGNGFLPENQGFDVNIGGHRRGSPPGGYFSPYKNPKLTDGPKGEYLTERLTSEAISFLQDVPDEQPFLLYFSYYTVHTPLQAPEHLVAKYRKKAAALKTRSPKWGKEGARKVRLVQDHPTYAAMVECLDQSVGRVVGALRASGQLSNTVIVFMSDNGGLSTSEGHPTSNLPLRAGKGWLNEGGIREPMFVVWPGTTKPASVCTTPVTSTDFYPTILEMAGLPARPRQHVDGVSFVAALRGQPMNEKRPLFWHHPHYGNQGDVPGGAVRLGRWKLIERYEEMDVTLFNIVADPGEHNDLAKAHPKITARMRRLLHDWRKTVDARMPTPNPKFDAKQQRRRQSR